MELFCSLGSCSYWKELLPGLLAYSSHQIHKHELSHRVSLCGEYFVSSTEKFLKWFSLSRGFFSPPTCLGCSLKTKWSRLIPYSLKVAPLNHRFKGFSAIASNFWAQPASDPVCTRTYTTQKCQTDTLPLCDEPKNLLLILFHRLLSFNFLFHHGMMDYKLA